MINENSLKRKAHNSHIMQRNFIKLFLSDAEENQLSAWKFSCLNIKKNQNNQIKSKVWSEDHFDVIYNGFSGGEKQGNLASANSTSNNIESPSIQVVHAIGGKTDNFFAQPYRVLS